MELRDLQDKQLLVLLKQSDSSVMTEIYDRYWKKLLAIAYNHLGDKDDAEEVVQTVFIKLWENRCDISIDRLPNYLATAVKYSVFSMIQKRSRKDEVGMLHVSKYQSKDYGEEKIYASFLKEYINGVVEELPDRCRLVFKYSREHGKTISEIAKAMDIADKTAEAHLTKALRRIKHSLRTIGLSILLTLTLYYFI